MNVQTHKRMSKVSMNVCEAFLVQSIEGMDNDYRAVIQQLPFSQHDGQMRKMCRHKEI